MNSFWMFLMLLLGLVNVSRAAEEPKFVSTTFQDIQSRVTQRDGESGAILFVKAKVDAPSEHLLNFSIEQHSYEAVIVLSLKLLTDGVYEKYHLRLDDAMREEIQKQKRLKELQAERIAKSVVEQKKEITELSGGKLSYGMSYKQVVKAIGKPDKDDVDQSDKYLKAFYPGMALFFTRLFTRDGSEFSLTFMNLMPSGPRLFVSEQKQQITKLSGGTLRYGMSYKEVKQIIGKPDNIVADRAGGIFTAFYPNAKLYFAWNRLSDMESTLK